MRVETCIGAMFASQEFSRILAVENSINVCKACMYIKTFLRTLQAGIQTHNQLIKNLFRLTKKHRFFYAGFYCTTKPRVYPQILQFSLVFPYTVDCYLGSSFLKIFYQHKSPQPLLFYRLREYLGREIKSFSKYFS